MQGKQNMWEKKQFYRCGFQSSVFMSALDLIVYRVFTHVSFFTGQYGKKNTEQLILLVPGTKRIT